MRMRNTWVGRIAVSRAERRWSKEPRMATTWSFIIWLFWRDSLINAALSPRVSMLRLLLSLRLWLWWWWWRWAPISCGSFFKSNVYYNCCCYTLRRELLLFRMIYIYIYIVECVGRTFYARMRFSSLFSLSLFLSESYSPLFSTFIFLFCS